MGLCMPEVRRGKVRLSRKSKLEREGNYGKWRKRVDQLRDGESGGEN